MASKLERKGLLIGLLATALSAMAWWFANGVQPLWWAAWLAPLPVLWLASRVRAGSAALVALVAYAIGALHVWGYLHDAIGIPLPFIAYAVVMPGIMLALCVLLYRRLLLRGNALAAMFAVPVIWVVLEYVSSRLSPHGTFFNLSYSQMDVVPVIQVAAITGIWGISFLLLLIPSALAVWSAPQIAARKKSTAAVIALACLGATLMYGGWRLQEPPTSTLRVGLVSLEQRGQPTLDSAAGQALVAHYADAVQRLAQQGAQVVVIPEASLVTGQDTIPELALMAEQHHVVVDFGVDYRGGQGAERNMAMVFQPGVASPTTYSKRHLIPGFEAKYTPGSEYQLLQGQPRIGLAICKDMDFIDTGTAYAHRRAQLLLVPAWDFDIDGWLHSRMAIMRGVEQGFAIARAARRGRLTLSDDRGRVLAEATSEGDGAELVGNLPLRETHTLYARWGDWFAWLNGGALLVLIGVAFIRRR
jgi:apolipoprotein N-acyltransferase